MLNTLVLFEGRMSSAERIANQLCYIIGSARSAEIDEAPADLTPYAGICFVFNFYGSVTAGQTKSWLRLHREALGGLRVAMVGIGYSDLGYTRYVSELEEAGGLREAASYFIASEEETARAGYEIGRLMHVPAKAMEEEALLQAIRAYIGRHTTLALATATDGYIRCTPLEYLFVDDLFYIVTEGGSKFRGIFGNGRVSAALFEEREGLTAPSGLQFLADAEAVPVGSAEYKVAMTANHITEEALEEMPVTLFLIRLTPLRYEYTDPALAAKGYDSHQSLDTAEARRSRKEGEAFVREEQSRGQPTFLIRDEHGEAREVTIPEIDVSPMLGVDIAMREAERARRKEESAKEEREKRRQELLRRRRRKQALLKKKRERELRDRDVAPLFDEPEEESALEEEKAPGEAEDRASSGEKAETGRSEKEALREKNRRNGSVFGRLGNGIGKMLRLEDDEDGEEDEEI